MKKKIIGVEIEEKKNDYGAMMSRCKLVHMTKTHKNTEKFPYTEDELAIYMLDYINFSKNKPIIHNIQYYDPD